MAKKKDFREVCTKYERTKELLDLNFRCVADLKKKNEELKRALQQHSEVIKSMSNSISLQKLQDLRKVRIATGC